MSNKDKSLQAEFEKQLEQKFEQESNEMTTSALDASIMQMAQKQLDEKVSKPQSWWHKFSKRGLKFPMSIAAALFVTLGIARFMAHLGGVDVALVQSEKGSAERRAAEYALEVDYQAEAKQKIEAPAIKSPEREDFEAPQVLAQEEQKQQSVRQELLNEVAAEQKTQEQTTPRKEMELRRKRAQSQKVVAADEFEESIVTTGSRVKRSEVESTAPVTTLAREEIAQQPVNQQQVNKPASQPLMVQAENEEQVVVAGSRILGDSSEESSIQYDETLDEDVLGYPLPEGWLEQIEELLTKGDEIKALDEWDQFRRTYPDYKVDDSLLEKIKSLQNLGKSD